MLPLVFTTVNHRRRGTEPRGGASLRRGFSITELLVVIGIIVLLIGILLPALGAAQQRARRTQTVSTMTGFAQACEAYRAEFDFYPGVVPERVLVNDPQISGTENALLALLGGYVREEDVGTASFNADFPAPWQLVTFAGPDGPYRIKINTFEIGAGPVVRGKQYAPFFSPRPAELTPTPGQFFTDVANPDADRFANDALRLPDLIDGWGNPIIYVRSLRATGPLVGPSGGSTIYQFDRRSMNPYLTSRGLGERNSDQVNSILRPGFANDDLLNAAFAQAIRHAGFGLPNVPLEGTARGSFVIISAGKDGVFFSSFDGPGSQSEPIDNLTTQIINAGPLIIEEFDDIRIFGGG